MKSIFPLLLCYVLMTAQTYALSGGPVFRSVNSYIGSYSGSLRATTDILNPASNNPKFLVPNAVGVFTFSVDATGSTNSVSTVTTGTNSNQVTTGTFLLFMNGLIFQGTISAIVNPVSGSMTGVIVASDSVTSTTTGSSTNLNANGYMNAKISANSTNSTSTALRVNGKATLQVDDGVVSGTTLQPISPTQTLMFNVSGFQQTSIVTISASSSGAASGAGTATGGTTGGTGGIGTGL